MTSPNTKINYRVIDLFKIQLFKNKTKRTVTIVFLFFNKIYLYGFLE